jgi:putative ABC transport system ATP-binding protein
MSSDEPDTGGADGSSPAAHAIDLVKTYGTGDAVVHALSGVTVEFARGRFTAVMGRAVPSSAPGRSASSTMAGSPRCGATRSVSSFNPSTWFRP